MIILKSKYEIYSNNLIDLRKISNKGISEYMQKCLYPTIDLSLIKANTLKNEIVSFIDYKSREISVGLYFYREYIRPLQHFVNFIESSEKYQMESILSIPENLEKEFLNFLELNLKESKANYSEFKIIKRIRDYTEITTEKKSFFEKDIWLIQDLNIDENRINKSEPLEKIDFRTIINLDNRKIIKLYMEYLIKISDLSLKTIYTRYKNNRDFSNFLKETTIKNVRRRHVENYYNYNKSKNLKPRTINQKIQCNHSFFDYLRMKKIVVENYFSINDMIKFKRTTKISKVDKHILNQIFNMLDEVDIKIRLMFLILYCTGMRVSELCQLKKDCLYKVNDKTFIRYYSQKMQKEVSNPIPESLHLMINEFIKEESNNEKNRETYLFPDGPNEPYTANKVRDDINKAFNEKEIKNSDGSLYRFRPHDYRHTLGTQMLERDIPLSVIQRILHHDSIEMTLSYAEVDDKRRINKYKEFINIKGEEIEKYTDEDLGKVAEIEWLRENINAQILPNGICRLPVKLGKCPHANSCLTCKKFATTLEYLDVHKEQLRQVNEYLVIAKENNWTRQIETNEETKRNLIIIIDKLESVKGCEVI